MEVAGAATSCEAGVGLFVVRRVGTDECAGLLRRGFASGVLRGCAC